MILYFAQLFKKKPHIRGIFFLFKENLLLLPSHLQFCPLCKKAPLFTTVEIYLLQYPYFNYYTMRSLQKKKLKTSGLISYLSWLICLASREMNMLKNVSSFPLSFICSEEKLPKKLS